MSKLRKTDAMRLKEKRGQGYGDKYIPWIFTHEVPSNGRTHNILGWKHRRVYHLLSDGELWAFLRLQMQDNVFDIREQFPLLPLVKTLKIAEKFNIEHPPRYKKEIADKIVITSDFNLLIRSASSASGIKEIVRTVKTEEDYNNPRTQEKLFIEKEFWTNKGIDWGVILHSEKSKVIGRNIYNIYQEYFWNDTKGFNYEDIEWLTYKLKDKLTQYNMDVLKAVNELDKILKWNEGEGLNFFKYLLTHKVIKTDFDIKFNYYDMKIWF